MRLFSVTYEIITPESAEYGDAEDRGWIVQDVCLRDALEEIPEGCHAESDSYSDPMPAPRWITFYETNEGTADFYESGDTQNLSLHFPDNITPSSAKRLARLLGVYGF